MIKRIRSICFMSIMMIMLAGCRPSAEKISEAENARNEMVKAREAAEETYLDITDSSKRGKLDELYARAAEIEAVDFSQMNDKKIDEYLPTITEVTESYNDIQGYLDGTLKSENAANEEAAKNIQIDAYAINKTGMNLTQLVLHDVTLDTFSDNLIGEGVVLNSGYTLMGIELEIRTESSRWEFLVKDENGTPHTLICDDLLEHAKEGVSLTLEYDEKTDTGRAVFGNYVRTAGEVAADEASSGEEASTAATSE